MAAGRAGNAATSRTTLLRLSAMFTLLWSWARSAAMCGSENNAHRFSSVCFPAAYRRGPSASPEAAKRVRRRNPRREIGGREIGIKFSTPEFSAKQDENLSTFCAFIVRGTKTTARTIERKPDPRRIILPKFDCSPATLCLMIGKLRRNLWEFAALNEHYGTWRDSSPMSGLAAYRAYRAESETDAHPGRCSGGVLLRFFQVFRFQIHRVTGADRGLQHVSHVSGLGDQFRKSPRLPALRAATR